MSNSEWKEYEMSELIEEISMGPFGSNIKVECFTDSGVPVLNGSNLVGFRLNEDSFNYVTEEKATSLGKANAYRGDIVITHRGTLGQIVYIPQNSKYSRYVISQSQFRVRCNEKVIPEYLVYYFHSRLGQHKLLSNASQVGVPSLARPTSTFQKLTISIPPVAKQKEIVKILSSLDDKIELNNAINRNLEEQAQIIFKNWFVDFEPFAKEPFIDALNEQRIPISLKMVQVNDLPHLLETGRRPKGGAVKEGIPSIGAENVKQLGVFDYSSDKFIPREFAESLGKGKINGYELLLYKDGGKPGTFIPHFSMFGEGYPYEECYINEHVFKLDFGDKGLNIFAYFYFQTDYVVSWLANNGGKAAIPGINQNDVNAIWIYDLSHPKVQEFGDIAKPMFEQILKNCKQNHQLSILRDSLLPKLMSGELDIADVRI